MHVCEYVHTNVGTYMYIHMQKWHTCSGSHVQEVLGGTWRNALGGRKKAVLGKGFGRFAGRLAIWQAYSHTGTLAVWQAGKLTGSLVRFFSKVLRVNSLAMFFFKAL